MMAAETIGLTMDKIHMISKQDTDVTPYDTGAYASRQSYVSGLRLRKLPKPSRKKSCLILPVLC